MDEFLAEEISKARLPYEQLVRWLGIKLDPAQAACLIKQSNVLACAWAALMHANMLHNTQTLDAAAVQQRSAHSMSAHFQ